MFEIDTINNNYISVKIINGNKLYTYTLFIDSHGEMYLYL